MQKLWCFFLNTPEVIPREIIHNRNGLLVTGGLNWNIPYLQCSALVGFGKMITVKPLSWGKRGSVFLEGRERLLWIWWFTHSWSDMPIPASEQFLLGPAGAPSAERDACCLQKTLNSYMAQISYLPLCKPWHTICLRSFSLFVCFTMDQHVNWKCPLTHLSHSVNWFTQAQAQKAPYPKEPLWMFNRQVLKGKPSTDN